MICMNTVPTNAVPETLARVSSSENTCVQEKCDVEKRLLRYACKLQATWPYHAIAAQQNCLKTNILCCRDPMLSVHARHLISRLPKCMWAEMLQCRWQVSSNCTRDASFGSCSVFLPFPFFLPINFSVQWMHPLKRVGKVKENHIHYDNICGTCFINEQPFYTLTFWKNRLYLTTCCSHSSENCIFNHLKCTIVFVHATLWPDFLGSKSLISNLKIFYQNHYSLHICCLLNRDSISL